MTIDAALAHDVLLVAASVAALLAVLAWVRRRSFVGVSDVTRAVSDGFTGAANATDSWGFTVMENTRRRVEGQIALATKESQGWRRLPVAMLVLFLAGSWVVVTALYVQHNARTVQAQEREAVTAGALEYDPMLPLDALARVLTPILLTAVAGVLLAEMVGLTDALPFIRRVRTRAARPATPLNDDGKPPGRLSHWVDRHPSFLPSTGVLVFAALLLVLAGRMQISVAEQAKARAANNIERVNYEKFTELKLAVVPPPDVDPVFLDEYAQREQQYQDFRRLQAREWESTNGTRGWRTWLPIGAIVADGVFAWALIDALILVGVLLQIGFAACLRLIAGLSNLLAGVVRFVCSIIQRMFNAPSPADADQWRRLVHHQMLERESAKAARHETESRWSRPSRGRASRRSYDNRNSPSGRPQEAGPFVPARGPGETQPQYPSDSPTERREPAHTQRLSALRAESQFQISYASDRDRTWPSAQGDRASGQRSDEARPRPRPPIEPDLPRRPTTRSAPIRTTGSEAHDYLTSLGDSQHRRAVPDNSLTLDNEDSGEPLTPSEMGDGDGR